jgi:hypothetical protein
MGACGLFDGLAHKPWRQGVQPVRVVAPRRPGRSQRRWHVRGPDEDQPKSSNNLRTAYEQLCTSYRAIDDFIACFANPWQVTWIVTQLVTFSERS